MGITRRGFQFPSLSWLFGLTVCVPSLSANPVLALCRLLWSKIYVVFSLQYFIRISLSGPRLVVDVIQKGGKCYVGRGHFCHPQPLPAGVRVSVRLWLTTAFTSFALVSQWSLLAPWFCKTHIRYFWILLILQFLPTRCWKIQQQNFGR